MTSPIHVFDVDERNRIALYHDEDAFADSPRGWGSDDPTHLRQRRTDSGYIQPDDDFGPHERAWLHFEDRFHASQVADVFERWLRIFDPDAVVAYGQSSWDRGAPEIFGYIAGEDVRKEWADDLYGPGATGTPRERALAYLEGSLETYRQWADGEVWDMVHERLTTWRRVDDPSGEERTDWEVVGSIGGVYFADAYDEAEVLAHARDYFDLPDKEAA